MNYIVPFVFVIFTVSLIFIIFIVPLYFRRSFTSCGGGFTLGLRRQLQRGAARRRSREGHDRTAPSQVGVRVGASSCRRTGSRRGWARSSGQGRIMLCLLGAILHILQEVRVCMRSGIACQCSSCLTRYCTFTSGDFISCDSVGSLALLYS